MEAMRKEDKARKQEVYLDSAVETLDFNAHMKGKQEVEHDFLESAKAKMAILRRFQSPGNEEAATIQ